MNASGADSGATDDMRTAWADLLTPEAQGLQRKILRAYHRSDTLAGSYQFRHRVATISGAACGTLAVCAAIYQLYQLAGHVPAAVAVQVDAAVQNAGEAVFQKAAIFEVIFAVVAAVAVIAGAYMALMRSWLLERHRAERLRLLKYRLLLSDFLRTAAAHPDSGLVDAASSFEEIDDLDENGLDIWLDANPRTLSFRDIPRSMSPLLENLARHYLNTRLRIHETFFHHKAQKHEVFDEATKHLPALCFFLSIFLACVHFTWEGLHHYDAKVGPAPLELLLLTAILPVLGAGIRTWRGAQEFSRNALRYGGYHLAVHDVTESLRTELEKDEPDPYVLLDGMAKGEHLFEDEHREWLRLTKEVEWFG
jgi:hypothetical protein